MIVMKPTFKSAFHLSLMMLPYCLPLAAVLIFASLSCTSCATGGTAAALSKISSTATEASLVLDLVDGFSGSYFVQHPNPGLEAKVDASVAAARAALRAALAAARGSEALSQQQVDAAFGQFREAYAQLLAIAGPIGVLTGATVPAPAPPDAASREVALPPSAGARLMVPPGAELVPKVGP